MIKEELIEKLKPEVEGLHRLLQNPEMGPITWQRMMLRRWEKVSNLWTGKKGTQE